VFAGPVAAGDIEGVLGQPGVADVVRVLATRSLVGVDRTRTPARFHLLQTVRSFAGRRLAEAGRTEEVARRHAEWFISVARAADLQLRTAEEARAHERLVSSFAELRAAHGWAARHDTDLAAELAACLYLYAQSRFVEEPLLWAELLLGRIPPDHPRRPTLLAAAATRALRRGDITEARRLAAEGVEIAGYTQAAIAALDVLTDAGLFDGRVGESGETARTLRDLAGQHGDRLHLALGHSGVALAAAYGGHARPDAEAELAALDELPLPPSGRGWLAYTRGELSQRHDRHRALARFADALAEARAVHNRYLEGAAIVSACSLRARTGDPDEALDAFAEAVRHWIRLANTTQQLTTLRNLAVLFQRAGAPEALAELLGAVDRGDVPSYGEEADRLNDARDWAVAELGPARFAALTEAGAARDITGAAHAALQAIDALASSRRAV
jgi:tetratricopeptide (TPR) repeat protein